MINDNIIDFIIKPGKADESAIIDYRPKVSSLKIYNKVITKTDGKNEIEFEVSSDGKVITVNGSITTATKEIIRNAPMVNPTDFARQALIDALQAEGIKINMDSAKKLPVFSSYNAMEPIVKYQSAGFAKYLRLILKVSHNTAADMLPLLIAAHQKQYSYDAGMKDIGDFLLNEVKLSPTSFSMLDASGANGNFVTSAAIIKLLSYMQNLPAEDFQVFFDALPILGVDGSLEHSGQELESKGKVHAKTGTELLNNLANPDSLVLTSKALAGYIEKEGKLLEFMVVVNNASITSLEQMRELVNDTVAVANTIYKYSLTKN